MAKYKIVYDRNACIAAGPCAAVNPEDFEIDASDGKANLIGGKEEDGKWVKIVDSEEKARQAAEVCPALVISVEKIED